MRTEPQRLGNSFGGAAWRHATRTMRRLVSPFVRRSRDRCLGALEVTTSGRFESGHRLDLGGGDNENSMELVLSEDGGSLVL